MGSARLYEGGLKSELDYQPEISALRAQLDAPARVSDMPDAAQALVMLGSLPTSLQAADATDRQALLHSFFTSVEIGLAG